MKKYPETYTFFYEKLSQLSEDPFSRDGDTKLAHELFSLGEMVGEHPSLNITKGDDDLYSVCIDASLYENGSQYSMTKKIILDRLKRLFTE